VGRGTGVPHGGLKQWEGERGCRGPNYMEVDVDVGSSRSAAHVVGLVQGALKTLVIDIAVLLEGRCPVRLTDHALPSAVCVRIVGGEGAVGCGVA
jgi:Protein ENHANCED DISEASE RESISTANCE 2, C-terminal